MAKLTYQEKLNQYYSKQTISENLKNIVPTGKDKGTAYANSVYEKFSITQYDSKEEYEDLVRSRTRIIFIRDNQDEITSMRKQRKDIKSYIDNAVNEKLEQGWSDYMHRDALIRTGQYEEFRIYDYRDKYLKSMKKWGIDEKYYKAIENATPEQLKDLFSYPNTKKDESAKRELPILGFYYGNISGNQLSEIINALDTAIAGTGIKIPEIDNKGEYDNSNEREHLKRTARTRVYTPTERSTARNAYRRLTRVHRPQAYNYEDLFNALLAQYDEGKITIRETKSKNTYIPFVGSSRDNTKNSVFMREFERYARALGYNFGK